MRSAVILLLVALVISMGFLIRRPEQVVEKAEMTNAEACQSWGGKGDTFDYNGFEVFFCYKPQKYYKSLE